MLPRSRREGPSSIGPRLISTTVPGPAGALEGLLTERDIEHALAAVVCHPHPLYGGTLHNKVVHRLASVLHGLGAAVLRFNFRGVGLSQGRFDGSEGEVEDARAALTFLEERHPSARLWAAGFSFGSWVAARLAASERRVERLVLVAPPVESKSFDFLRAAKVPKLVIQGEDDDVCPLASLEREYPAWAEPKELARVAGANHFFDRQLGALAKVLDQVLSGPAKGSTS
ncbi:MAG: alpha/beta fold hydrolase [Candidatus Eisenbacteria bacterium]|uniref:Alpha/beta fold hydrolase n=1 Tax=Eiseniibacteriota bacterium TaxID=2212470 RepID=A0A538TVD5_UNCEI|nr:MAG: alpha/beta fold hydrolase [Candidatus Eisenbacteria bacterium]